MHNLIDWLNKNHSCVLTKLPLNKDSLENSSWLSGFVDADGSFSVQHTKTETGAAKRKIACRLRIEQRILDPKTNESYFEILNQICLFLNCNLLTRNQKSTGNTYYTLAASSKVSLNIMTQYFNKHPLFSSKFLDYKDWELVPSGRGNSFPRSGEQVPPRGELVAKLIINNKHLMDEGINTVELVRNRMNTKRVYFNWDHLKGLG